MLYSLNEDKIVRNSVIVLDFGCIRSRPHPNKAFLVNQSRL